MRIVPKTKQSHEGRFFGYLVVMEEGKKTRYHNATKTRTNMDEALTDAIKLKEDMKDER